MSRRLVYALALLSFGLMVGVIIGRFFVPEKYGLGTLVLVFLGSLAAGALGWSAWSWRRGYRLDAEGTRPFQWKMRFGTRGMTVRWDPLWGQTVQERWLGTKPNDPRGLGAFWDAHWAQVRVPNAIIVLGALGIGVLAQLLILGSLLTPGLILYAAAGIGLVVWVWRQHISLFQLVSAARIGRRVEVLLLVLILLVAFGARMIQAGTHPAGIDGDELKWTAQTYYDFVARETTGDFSGQQKWTPVSFYLEKIAFDLFGVDFNSPRIFTALLSFLATLVLYFVARDMFNVSVALISTLLMATSYYDVNTSRQAIVETFTKLPMILALFLVIRGVDRQRWFYFLLCGISLYAGIMTYDTFFVVPPVIIMYLLFRGALDWRRFYRWILYLALVLAPMLLAYPIVADTVAGRQYTYVKGVSTGVQELLSENTIQPLVDNTVKSFAALFQVLQGADYALDWQGPLVNPIVLPFLVLGFALVLARFWQRHNLLLILSFVVCFFPAPILSGYTVPRVFYVGLPPIFIFAGVFVAALAAAVLNLGERHVPVARFAVAAITALLALIALTDLYIYWTQLANQDDWLKRRALVQAVQDSVKSAPFTFVPVTRSTDDYVWGNTPVLEFLAYTAVNDKEISQHFQVVDFAELPGALGTVGAAYDRVNILYDKDMNETSTQASSTIETIKRCYGNVETQDHEYFDIYSLEQAELAAPSCYSLTSLEPLVPNPDGAVAANEPLTFAWQADSERPTAYQVQVEQRHPKLIWIEGESFPRENDWMFEAKADHYPGFLGDGYLLDSTRSGETRVDADVLEDGTYQVWVRWIRNTIEGHQSFLTVGDRKLEFARSGENELEEWNWEKIGQVDLTRGKVPLVLSREYGNEGWKPVLIDAIFLSADADFNPAEDLLWARAVNTEHVQSDANEFVLESGLPAGVYRWRVQLSDGDKLVDASGRKGVWSDKVEFRVE